MRRVFSVVVAVALVLALGALAVMALPPATAPMATAPAAFAAAPEAPAAAQSYNMIAMPLDATDQFASVGAPFTASGLASLVGTGVVQVSRFDAEQQFYESWNTDFGGYGTDFPLLVGGAYWLVLDSGASDLVSFVGDVPTHGSVQFNFVSGLVCQFNEFSLPLDQSAIANASELATAIGTGVVQVAQWNASAQNFETWNTDFGGYGSNFVTRIGYPYLACLVTGAPSVWP